MTDIEIKAKAFDYINMFLIECDIWSFSTDKIDLWAEYAKSIVYQICGTVVFAEYLIKQLDEEYCTEKIEEKDLVNYVI